MLKGPPGSGGICRTGCTGQNWLCEKPLLAKQIIAGIGKEIDTVLWLFLIGISAPGAKNAGSVT